MQTEPLKHGLAKLLSKYHGGYNRTLNGVLVYYQILCNIKELIGTVFMKVLKMKKKGGEEVKKEVKWRGRENTRLEASCKHALSLNFDQC